MSGFIKTTHVPSSLQLADIMTKALSRPLHQQISSKLGLVQSSQSSLKGGYE